MKTLPSFVVFRLDFENKYEFLVYARKAKVLFMSPNVGVLSPYVKFAVERASDGLVHIRSCYNNKYLSRTSSTPSSNTLVAPVSSEPVINKSAWNCTLFRPEFFGAEVSLYHVGTGMVLHVLPTFIRLTLQNGSPNQYRLTPIDIESIVNLPKRVTFKGNNGRYLRVHWQDENRVYNQFSCEDPSDKAAQYEICFTRKGDIRVKSVQTGKFWRRSPNWIWCDSNDTTTNNPDTLFEVVKVGDNVIALRNQGNKGFCKSLSTDGKWNCLNAASSSIVPEARLIIKEPVISRKIDVQFRLEDARIYNKRLIQAASVTVPNGTDKDHEIEQGFSYTKSKTGTWSSTTTLKLGCKASVSSGIPFLANGEIEVSGEVSEEVQFGESQSFSQQLTSTYKVPVPAKTKATVKLLASEAKYDIPFSYVQKDQYSTGEKVITDLEDGLYQGIEAYDFYYEAKYEPL